MIRAITKCVNYWYYRYMLESNLYMLEKWEQVLFYIAVFIILVIISTFNGKIVLQLVKLLYEPSAVGLIDAVLDMVIILSCLVGYIFATS